jgi:hypothetical protein
MPAGFKQLDCDQVLQQQGVKDTIAAQYDLELSLAPWSACVQAVAAMHEVSVEALTRREGHSSAKLTQARRLLCHGWVQLAGDKALAVLWLQAFTTLTRGSILNILVRNNEYPAPADLELFDTTQKMLLKQQRLDPGALPRAIAGTVPSRKKTQAGLPRRSGPKRR